MVVITWTVKVVLDILARRMVDTVQGASGFIIDGFPLDLEEAAAFEKQIVPVTRYIYIGYLFTSHMQAMFELKVEGPALREDA